MKKHSSLILFLAALLCVSMLLVSCDFGAVDETGDEVITEAPTEEPEAKPEDVKVDYAAIMAQWNTYLTYTDPNVREDALTQGTEVFSTVYDENHYVVSSDVEGRFLIVKEVFLRDVTVELPMMPPETVKTIYKYTYKVYNVSTGENIFIRSVDYDEESSYNSVYLINAVKCNGFSLPLLAVTSISYEIAESVDTTTPLFKQKISYSCYDETGSAIYENMDEVAHTARQNVIDGTYTVEIGETVSVYDAEGVYITSYEKGSERYIPVTNSEYGEYLYRFEGGSVIVFDQNYQKLCEYEISAFLGALQDTHILQNGNLLYRYLREESLPEIAYDYETVDRARFSQVYEIVDVKSGEIKTVDRDFLLVNMMTAAMSDSTGIGFKGEYQLAVIQKIADKELSSEYTVAILDNELNVVAELPSFVVNQTAVHGMLDAEHLLVSSHTKDGQTLYYTVNVSKNEVSLYIDVSDSSYARINNGFIYRNTLYNNDAQKLLDLEEYDWLGDSLVLKDDSLTLAYIKDGKLEEKTLSSEISSYRTLNGILSVSVQSAEAFPEEPEDSDLEDIPESLPTTEYKLYNMDGSLLLTLNSEVYQYISGDGYTWIISDGTYYFFK